MIPSDLPKPKKIHFAPVMWCILLILISGCIRIEEDPYNRCPSAIEADAIGIKQVFFSPYRNQAYSLSTDTVSFKDFRFNFELDVKKKENALSQVPQTYAYSLVCEEKYRIQNISNLTVILTAPFAGLPVGTDIAYALRTSDGKRISELRNFEEVSVYFGSSLTLNPEPYSQLKTRIFVFFRNGTQAFLDSTSPYLKTN